MSDAGPVARLRLLAGDADLRQPDPRSCGAACLVVARALLGRGDLVDVGAQVLEEHRRVVGWWPRALGTPPWAVARELGRLTGRPHRVRLARGRSGWAALGAALADGDLVAVYVGDRRTPRHVVLALALAGDRGEPGEQPERVAGFDPARGGVVTLTERDWTARSLAVAGWSTPWLIVLPVRGRRTRA